MNKINGVVIGTVKSAKPDKLGRVKVEFPWVSDKNESPWIRIATLMGGSGRGSWFMPEPGDEVLVSFQHGDPNHPYIIGFLWNGKDLPPETDPKRRVIRSVNGHEISFYDPGISEGNKGYVRISDAHGNKIELANSRITITSKGGISINAPNLHLNGRLVATTPTPI